MKPSWLLLAVIVIALAITGWQHRPSSAPKEAIVDHNGVALSALAIEGHETFKKNCARCHGEYATGTNSGPPLIHDIYNPGHHGDGAFYRAVRQGSPQHHWNFGNMPPQPQVSDAEIASIIRYIRETQVANGIVYKKHVM
ncbi:MAG: cytochrome C [Robiginitomaculum sp.]|nr:MAG: cytochrome C [Robiginitomaculum sp.]